jgi:hypothetical protein
MKALRTTMLLWQSDIKNELERRKADYAGAYADAVLKFIGLVNLPNLASAAVLAGPTLLAPTLKSGAALGGTLSEAGFATALRVAPRITGWALRHPVLTAEIGTAAVGTGLEVAETGTLNPLQLVFNLLHLQYVRGGQGSPRTPGLGATLEPEPPRGRTPAPETPPSRRSPAPPPPVETAPVVPAASPTVTGGTVVTPAPPVTPVRPIAPTPPTLTGLRRFFLERGFAAAIRGTDLSDVLPRIGAGGTPGTSRQVPALVQPSPTTIAPGPTVAAPTPVAPAPVVPAAPPAVAGGTVPGRTVAATTPVAPAPAVPAAPPAVAGGTVVPVSTPVTPTTSFGRGPGGGGPGSPSGGTNLVLVDTNIAVRLDFPGVSSMFHAQDDVQVPQRLVQEVNQVSENAVGHAYDLGIPEHPHIDPPQAVRDEVRESFFDASGVVGARRDPFDTGVIYDMELVMQARVSGATVASNDVVLVAVALDLNVPVRCSPPVLRDARDIVIRMRAARTPPAPRRPTR